MNPTLLLLANIAQAFGVLATNPAFKGKADKVGEYAGLVGFAFQQVNIANEDREVLLTQIKAANERGDGTGLTEEEKAAWRKRHVSAHNAIQAWEPVAAGPVDVG